MPDIETATNTEHARRVREMFDGIAGRYDLLNHVLSLNIDKQWRRVLTKRLSGTDGGDPVLDVACGTGDLSIDLHRAGLTQVVGLDFCRPMLVIAKSKVSERKIKLPLIEGDALNLPFSDGSFAVVTIGFGLRNLSSVERGLQELYRVLKPGGRLAVLEFSKPGVPILSWVFRVYFSKVLPLLGGLISGSRSAYEYLPDSVRRFPDQRQLAALMSAAGFTEVSFENLSGGIAALHFGTRAG
ncbi:MAG TPA: bifunctional demethylmenaquinone methyltransferase/2-methoxy-6-polyprenyl-1,4-benzoquinol methylase UbiE [Pyrinomonadaceae bacterium]|nr:bifunctional demethylmenaquinone methyltransferase/2-methoxy-6-polyprenyl-1,4-benzoquinol methylase UbiE [Pyrinomonadaceae bacterium]